ncbi:MAG: HyaD/HybD family hydrogenase maturation endopeptidase [Rhodocyclaceae bacterium]|nr:HyaD/HybD family hydrogenase maturation endopeptidase [Rhodocyclaceae bacterium]
MHPSTPRVLILGIGNLLWADEGFGIRCAEALAASYELPESVTVMDGGTQGLYLLPYVTEATHLLVFDAIDYGLPPGTMKLVRDDEVPRFMGAKKMSLHQTGFQEVIASAALVEGLPAEMVLIGVQPAELEDFGGSLREPVRACLPRVLEAAVTVLREWGVDVRPRDGGAERLNAAPLSIHDYEAGRPSEAEACRIGDARFMPGGAG